MNAGMTPVELTLTLDLAHPRGCQLQPEEMTAASQGAASQALRS